VSRRLSPSLAVTVITIALGAPAFASSAASAGAAGAVSNVLGVHDRVPQLKE
jgi:hypothetical protein